MTIIAPLLPHQLHKFVFRPKLNPSTEQHHHHKPHFHHHHLPLATAPTYTSAPKHRQHEYIHSDSIVIVLVGVEI